MGRVIINIEISYSLSNEIRFSTSAKV